MLLVSRDLVGGTANYQRTQGWHSSNYHLVGLSSVMSPQHRSPWSQPNRLGKQLESCNAQFKVYLCQLNCWWRLVASIIEVKQLPATKHLCTIHVGKVGVSSRLRSQKNSNLLQSLHEFLLSNPLFQKKPHKSFLLKKKTIYPTHDSTFHPQKIVIYIFFAIINFLILTCFCFCYRKETKMQQVDTISQNNSVSIDSLID